MQPNTPNSQQPNSQVTPVNYLDSIAVKPQQQTLNPFVLWGIIAGVLALAATMVLVLASSSDNPKSTLTAYQLKVESFENISLDAQDDIQSSELRSINSNLSLALAGAKQGVAEFQTEKVDKKSDVYINSVTETESLKDKLEEARLNAVYDRVYARELRFALTSLGSQMEVLYDNTKSESLREYLEDTDNNLTTIRDDLSKFNAE